MRLALRMILRTLVRKSELIQATWDEVDFENATWTIPKQRMKRRNPHLVYLSRQALDIFTGSPCRETSMSTWLDHWDRRYIDRVQLLVEILPVLAQGKR